MVRPGELSEKGEAMAGLETDEEVNVSEPKVLIETTVEQAQAIAQALDLYMRICLGQFEAVAHLVREGMVPLARPAGEPAQMADIDTCDTVAALMDTAKRVLGHPSSGSNGIGHPHVATSGHRAYEVMKVLEKTLAEHRDPTPAFRGVHYDGLTVRYTQDPTPVATVRTER